jgi:hypothetical protein
MLAGRPLLKIMVAPLLGEDGRFRFRLAGLGLPPSSSDSGVV